MSVQIKTSIIGCGMISGTHVTAMRDAGAAVVGVFDRNYDAALQFAESNGLKVYRTLEELLTDVPRDAARYFFIMRSDVRV